MSREQWDLLVFDLDGTLVDSQCDIADAVNYIRSLYHKPPLTIDTVRSFIGNGVGVLVERVLPGIPENERAAALQQFRAYYREHLLDKTALYPQITLILTRLEKIKKAVLTNKLEGLSKEILKRLDLLHRFSLVWGGDTGPKKKPDPEPLFAIMRQLKISPANTLMIGDGVNDILAAKAAGVRCAAALYGYTVPRKLRVLKPDYVLNSPVDLLQILGQKNNK